MKIIVESDCEHKLNVKAAKTNIFRVLIFALTLILINFPRILSENFETTTLLRFFILYSTLYPRAGV